MRKPNRCPACKSTKIAKLYYGMPMMTAKLRRKIATDKVVLAGCLVGGDNPKWQCVKCGVRIFDDRTIQLSKTTKGVLNFDDLSDELNDLNADWIKHVGKNKRQ